MAGRNGECCDQDFTTFCLFPSALRRSQEIASKGFYLMILDYMLIRLFPTAECFGLQSLYQGMLQLTGAAGRIV